MAVTWTPPEAVIPVLPFYEGDTINLSIFATPDIGTITTYSVLLNEIPVGSGISVTPSVSDVAVTGTAVNVLDQTEIHYSVGDDVTNITVVNTTGEVPDNVNIIKYLSDTRIKAQYALNVQVEVDELGVPTFYQNNYTFEVHNDWDSDGAALVFLMTNKDNN